MTIKKRFATTRSLPVEWLGEQGYPVTVRTVQRRIRFFGLQHYRSHLVLPMTVEHRRQRLQWCRKRQHWNVVRSPFLMHLDVMGYYCTFK